MKNALILQGWYQKPTSNWYPWLKKELEKKGYTVIVPDLPTIHTDAPDWAEIKKTILDLDIIDNETLIVGHSLGCLMALKIAEEYKYNKMILVAGWDFNDLTVEHQSFWEQPIKHKKITNHVKNIICIASDNDPYFTWCTNEEMSRRLNAKPILVQNAGHFTEEFGIKEIPEILKLI